MPEDLGALVAKLAADMSDLKRGLAEGRAEFTSFQSMIESGAAKVKQLLAFAGVAVGIGAAISKIKELGAEILDLGGKSELLRVSAYAIGQHYGMASGSVDVYVQKLKEMGIEEDKALQSVNNFLKAGVSIDQLPDLAQAAKKLAPSMGMFFNDAYASIISAVTKGTPKALAELTPGVKQALQAASSETLKMLDSTILSGTERTQIMVDFVKQAAAKMQTAGDDAANSYMRKLEEYKLAAKNAKEALFELVKPVAMAVTGAEIQSWQDFYAWIAKNKQQLMELGEIIGVYIQKGFLGTKQVIDFVYAHKDLLKVLLEVATVMKIISWFTIAEGAGAAAIAVGGLTGKLAALRLALSSPWTLVITVSILGLMEGLKQLDKLSKGAARGPTLAGEAYNLMTPEQQKEIDQAGRDEFEGYEKPTGVTGKLPKQDPEVARLQAALAAAQGKKEQALPPGGKGGGAAAPDDHLLRLELAMFKAQRDEKLSLAQNYYDELKARNDKSRAEEAQNLAAGLIDGQTYYARLQELQQQETAGALAMIVKKKDAQQKSYQDSLRELEADAKLSPEAKNLAQQKLAAENRKAIAKLDAEAAMARLTGEKQITEELTRQVKVRQQYQDQTAALNIETAALLGAISGQEATLQKLYLDWQNAKRKAIEEGASPEALRAMELNLQAKQADVKYGGYASAITQGISSLIDSLMQGGQDLKKAANNIFKSLFNEALKPGLEQLRGMLVNGFKELFGAAGAGLASAVMGAIGLLGMLLTSSGSSSYSASGVTSGVTASEAIRGVIAGPTSIPIAEINIGLREALLDTNNWLSKIEGNTRGGAGGGLAVSVAASGLAGTVRQAIREEMERYFEDVLMQGAT
jgi:hypothetical protein